MLSLYLALIASIVPTALAGAYAITDTYVGSAFLSSFVHENILDPTHGRVNYLDQATAVSLNLTYAQGDTLVLRVDSTTVLDPSGPGRNSVRLRSQNTYTTHVAVFDIAHMPEGCATWPAAWETSVNDWPNLGEVDILEGVNDLSPDTVTLHTNANCSMPQSRDQSGNPTGNICDVVASGNTGCGVQVTTANSYGPSFNSVGGGFYAMERTDSFIKVWFWQRGDGSTPGDMEFGATSVNTDTWGQPSAFFPNTECDIGAHFGPNNVIINTSLCGDWAGIPSVFNGAGCPGDCNTFVDQNPSTFVNAYWEINAIRVYT